MVLVLVSGGKDSTATLLLAIDKFGTDRVKGIFADTGIEHSETYKYLDYLEKTLGVEIIRVRSRVYKNIFDLIRQKKKFPSARFRFCTVHLKVVPVVEFLVNTEWPIREVWMGIRRAESKSRGERYKNVTPDTRILYADIVRRSVTKKLREVLEKKQIYVRYPIVDWTKEQVISFIKRKGIKLNPLYERGNDRVGCFPCVIGRQKEFELAWKDREGRENIIKFLEIEKELNRKGFNTRLKDHISAEKLVKRLSLIEKQLLLFR